MYKEDLALNNLKWLICYKTQPNLTKTCLYLIYMYEEDLALPTMVDIPLKPTKPNSFVRSLKKIPQPKT